MKSLFTQTKPSKAQGGLVILHCFQAFWSFTGLCWALLQFAKKLQLSPKWSQNVTWPMDFQKNTLAFQNPRLPPIASMRRLVPYKLMQEINQAQILACIDPLVYIYLTGTLKWAQNRCSCTKTWLLEVGRPSCLGSTNWNDLHTFQKLCWWSLIIHQSSDDNM